jgi:uncharacterized protein
MLSRVTDSIARSARSPAWSGCGGSEIATAAREDAMSNEGGTCTHCGACCVTYHVLFLGTELDSVPGGMVPAAFAESINDREVCMRGTRVRPRRCLALQGTIGADVSCAIYANRPSPCRAFGPEAAAGHGDATCGDARRLCGLPPLGGSYDGFPVA